MQKYSLFIHHFNIKSNSLLPNLYNLQIQLLVQKFGQKGVESNYEILYNHYNIILDNQIGKTDCIQTYFFSTLEMKQVKMSVVKNGTLIKVLIGLMLILPRCAHVPTEWDVTSNVNLESGDRLFITKLEHETYRAKIVTAEEILGKRFARTSEILEETGADICLNGSFFEADGSPSGLYISNRSVKSPYVPGKGDGILFTNKNGELNLIPLTTFLKYETTDFVDALQLNLLSLGDDILYRWWRWHAKEVPRNLIGINKWGVVDVIFKNTNLVLGDKYMRSVHKCYVVGALDGGGSASGIDRLGNGSYDKDIDKWRETRVPIFILIFLK